MEMEEKDLIEKKEKEVKWAKAIGFIADLEKSHIQFGGGGSTTYDCGAGGCGCGQGM